MRIITKKPLVAFYTRHPEATEPLERWYKIIKSKAFCDFTQLKQLFPSADQVGKATVFNIAGNHYRLITAIHYDTQRIFVLEVMTHAEYSKATWKQRYQVFS